MENEENTAIASLQQEVLWLSRSLRTFISAFVAASSFRLWTALRNGTEYKEFFGNMLAGAKIPELTILLADYHVHIYTLSVAVSALVVSFIVKKNSQPGLLGLASVVGVANFAFAEFASYWFWKPVAEVMRQLTG